MRSQLLLFVAHLPTIQESWKEMLPGGPDRDPPSPIQDDYMRSIGQLAQPTSVLNETVTGARLSRPHWPTQACRKSCPTGSLQDSQQPLLSGASTTDPPGWLFGQSQEKQQKWRDLPRRTGPSVDTWGPHRQVDSSKAQEGPGKLCDAKTLGHCPVRLLKDQLLGSCSSQQPTQVVSFPPSSYPSTVLRNLYLHLQVIHEL
ncbi:LOW QUALITY PROTEIN: protein DEPP1 [Rhynchonycteris naso]